MALLPPAGISFPAEASLFILPRGFQRKPNLASGLPEMLNHLSKRPIPQSQHRFARHSLPSKHAVINRQNKDRAHKRYTQAIEIKPSHLMNSETVEYKPADDGSDNSERQVERNARYPSILHFAADESSQQTQDNPC
jgi:hypothetical protein